MPGPEEIYVVFRRDRNNGDETYVDACKWLDAAISIANSMNECASITTDPVVYVVQTYRKVEP